MPRQSVDAIVVGSGAAGGIVAKQLAEAGHSVVLLEWGSWHASAEFRKDDLKNQRNWVLGPAFGPDVEKCPRVFVDRQGNERIVRPTGYAYNHNAMCVGGGTLSYGAMAWRFMEQDFRMKSLYGVPENSTLDDWPISYDDLEPHYEQAEREIGVSGDQGNDPFKAPRKNNLPMPPLPPNKEYRVLRPALERLGLHPFDIPMLRNSVPYNGRPGCMRCRWCVGFACECNAKGGTQNTVIPQAIKTGLCEVRTECKVKEIITDAQGKAAGVRYFDADDELQTLHAEIVVVSGGAIESARLLLNSKSKRFPNGIGNRHDWVGRNLQGHTYTGAFGLFDEDVFDDLGPGASIAICDYNHGNPGLVGGALLANEFIRLPYQFARMGFSGVPRWGKARKDFIRQYYRRHIGFQGPTQEIPNFEARVQADPVVRDYWGIPVARLSGSKHAHSVEVGNAMSKKAEAVLWEAGAIEVQRRGTGMGLSGGQHQAGTCRMGNDPQTSVVDRHCRVHDVDNLYVVDASVHVTNGGFNPVLTIMAIAYYASAHINKQFTTKAV